MRALLAAPFALAVLLPPLFVGGSVWLWHSNLAHPWWFIATGLCLLYGASFYLMIRQFRNIGVTGVPSPDGGRRIDAILRREAISSLLYFFVVATSSLWLLQWLLSW